MGQIYVAGQKPKIFLGDQKVKKMYRGNEQIYSSGTLVTYHIDVDNSVQEEIEDGFPINLPSFTPEKMDWDFLGWRGDGTADQPVWGEGFLATGEDVYSTDENPIDTAYAVFYNEYEIKYNANGGSGTMNDDSAYSFYNNGGQKNAVTTTKPNGFTRANYTFRYWALNSTSGSTIAPGTDIPVSNDIELFAIWVANTSGNVAGNGNYITTAGELSASIWYRLGTVSSTGYIQPNYQGVYKTCKITLHFNGNNFDDWWINSRGATIAVNGTRIYNSGSHLDNEKPNDYTFTTSSTSIPVVISVHNNENSQSFCGMTVTVTSAIFSI